MLRLSKLPYLNLASGPLFGLVLALLFLLFLQTGCATYRAGYGDRQLPGGYRTVAVPVFKNLTHETAVEVYFTNAIIRELERSKTGRVTDKAGAQVTLEGTIDSIQYVAGSALTDQNIPLPRGTVLNTEYRIMMRASLRLVRNSDQRVLWQAGFDGERQYYTPRVGVEELTGANAQYNHSARYQNFQDLASELMSQAIDRLTENF